MTMENDMRPATCPNGHPLTWLTEDVAVCPCQGYYAWMEPPFSRSTAPQLTRIIASPGFDALRSALAQALTERDHWKAAVEEANALAVTAGLAADRERERAAILTEQRDEAVDQSIGLARESDRLLDIHTELGLSDDGDAVTEIKKIRERAEKAEANNAALRQHIQAIDRHAETLIFDHDVDEFDEEYMAITRHISEALLADNPGAASGRTQEVLP